MASWVITRSRSARSDLSLADLIEAGGPTDSLRVQDALSRTEFVRTGPWTRVVEPREHV